MNDAVAPDARERWVYGALAGLLAVLWLATLGARPLFNPDEGRYAEIPREMFRDGDWVVPHLNGLAYIEKPPLQYWATAWSYRLWGVNEFTARLYPALAALATLVVVALAARRLWGPDAAWRAAAVLAGMLLFVVLGQLLTLDMSLTFYMTSGLAAFLLAQTAARPRNWMLVAWAAAGLGVLTKGLVAAAIPAAVLILYSAYSRDFTPWRRLCVILGLPLLLLITVPWHWLAARRLDDFLEFFFVHEHLSRYLTPSAGREQPWWFFGGVFLAGSAPWTLSAVRVLGGGWRRRARAGGPNDGEPPVGGPAIGGLPARFDPVLFLWIWIVFIGVFFSLSDSKLMPYILPLMPALALLIAALPTTTLRRDLKFTAAFTGVAGVALGVACLNASRLLAHSDRSVYWLPMAGPLKEVALLLAVTGAFVLVRCRRDATRSAVFLGVGWCLAWLLVMRASAPVAPIYSGVDMAAALMAADRAAPVYSVGSYDQSLTFYLGRTVTLVEYRGELDYGLRRAPGGEMTEAEFMRRWSQPTQAFAIMETNMFNEFKRRNVPMRLVQDSVTRVLVSRQ